MTQNQFINIALGIVVAALIFIFVIAVIILLLPEKDMKHPGSKQTEMSNHEYILAFKEKQGIADNAISIVNEMVVFEGFWVTLEDIKVDIDHNIDSGTIRLYASERIQDGYVNWLKDNYFL